MDRHLANVVEGPRHLNLSAQVPSQRSISQILPSPWRCCPASTVEAPATLALLRVPCFEPPPPELCPGRPVPSPLTAAVLLTRPSLPSVPNTTLPRVQPSQASITAGIAGVMTD